MNYGQLILLLRLFFYLYRLWHLYESNNEFVYQMKNSKIYNSILSIHEYTNTIQECSDIEVEMPYMLRLSEFTMNDEATNLYKSIYKITQCIQDPEILTKKFMELLHTNDSLDIVESKELQIYAYTKICNEEKEDDKSSKNNNSKTINKIEKITIQLFSYKSDINTIKDFVEKITQNYLSSLEDLRDNKTFIYTLTKTKYEDSRYELWDENVFSSTRQFSNIFFENKEKLINKIDFFINNKEWYFKESLISEKIIK